MSECPKFLEPRLRLFLSADIIGSTALKQSRLGAFDSSGPAHVSWFTTIQGFYFEAQQHFMRAWNDLKLRHKDNDYFGEAPKLWKTIGDEVLFTKLITDHRQVAVTLQCWVKALGAIREFLRRDGGRLGVKSTTWLAGFPFRNKEVVLSGESFSGDDFIEDYYKENGIILNKYYEKDGDGINIDYIGPSIDTGFRLTGQATSRKLILSIDVAYILALTSPAKKGPIDPIKIRYEGQVSLKGVLGGANYPLFWMDLADGASSAVLEDKLTKSSACDRDEAQAFCEAFYAENSDFIFPPFVISETEQVISHKPEWYDDRHANLVKTFLDSEIQQPEPDPDQTSVNSDEFNVQLQSLIDSLDKSKFTRAHALKIATIHRKKPSKNK